MKKLLIITNLFWICLIFLPSFIKPNQPNTTASGSSDYHLIDASLAKLLVQNYRDFYVNTFIKKKATVIDNSNGVQNNMDSRSVWFSLKKLKAYIHDMDSISLGCNSQDPLTGLRFYYIKYPERDMAKAENPWRKYGYFTKTDMPANYADRHSLMIVPTHYNPVNDSDEDYDPRFCSAGKFENISSVMNTLIQNEKKENGATLNINISGPKDKSKTSFLLTESAATNRGTVHPPPYPIRLRSNMISDLPCTGVNLMYFVDGFENCGKQSIIVKPTEKTSDIKSNKVLIPE